MARTPTSAPAALPASDQALLRAAYDADTKGVIAALEDGANVNAVDSSTGLSALHIAVGTNNLPLTQILVEDWEAAFGPDARGRWPTVIAGTCRVDEALADYIVEAEAKSLSSA
jgi:hypothetical protein